MMKKYDNQFGLDQRDESLKIKKRITRGVNQQIGTNAVLASQGAIRSPRTHRSRLIDPSSPWLMDEKIKIKMTATTINAVPRTSSLVTATENVSALYHFRHTRPV
jgi:hypothetical protein